MATEPRNMRAIRPGDLIEQAPKEVVEVRLFAGQKVVLVYADGTTTSGLYSDSVQVILPPATSAADQANPVVKRAERESSGP